MSCNKDGNTHLHDEENPVSPDAVQSVLDSLVIAADNQVAPVTLQNAAEASASETPTEQRKSVSDEFGVMEISDPDGSSASASSLPSSNQDSESKSNGSDSLRKNPMLLNMLDNCPTNLPFVFPPTIESISFPGSSKASNIDDTAVFKIPEIPPNKKRKRPINEAYEAQLQKCNIAEQEASKKRKYSATSNSNLKNVDLDSHSKLDLDNKLQPADKLASDPETKLTVAATSETKDNVEACQVNSDFVMSSESDMSSISDLLGVLEQEELTRRQRELALLTRTDVANAYAARENLLKALDLILAECSNDVSTIAFNFPPGEDHLIIIYQVFTTKIIEFKSLLEEYVEFVRGMEYTPFMNASSLQIKVMEVFGKGKDVEDTWENFFPMPESHQSSITVKTMFIYYCRCAYFIFRITEALNQYVETLPRYYPVFADASLLSQLMSQ